MIEELYPKPWYIVAFDEKRMAILAANAAVVSVLPSDFRTIKETEELAKYICNEVN